MLFLTFRHADFHFAPGIFPVQRERHYGEAFAVDASVEGFQFALVQQQLTGAGRTADVM